MSQPSAGGPGQPVPAPFGPGGNQNPGALFAAAQQQEQAALAALLGGGAPGFAGLAGFGGFGGLAGPGGVPGADAFRQQFGQQALLQQLGGLQGGLPPQGLPPGVGVSPGGGPPGAAPPGNPGQDLLLARLLQQQGGAGMAGLAGLGRGAPVPGAPGMANLQAQQELELQLLQQQEAELARARRQRAVEAEAAAMAARAQGGQDAGDNKGRGGAPGQPMVGAPGGGPGVPPDSVVRTPGSVVVPCRARGMPMDHNFRVRHDAYWLYYIRHILCIVVYNYIICVS